MIDECEICGCTDLQACVDPETFEPCFWLAPGLCSACEFAPIALRAPMPHERLPSFEGFVLNL